MIKARIKSDAMYILVIEKVTISSHFRNAYLKGYGKIKYGYKNKIDLVEQQMHNNNWKRIS